jgi:hypothetical protein
MGKADETDEAIEGPYCQCGLIISLVPG